jgi:hypothetical protein
MDQAHPDVSQTIRTILLDNEVLESIGEIQYATQMVARYDTVNLPIYGFIQVFNTGAIVVQGQPSPLTQWLKQVRDHVNAGKAPPPFRFPAGASPAEHRMRPPAAHSPPPRDGVAGTSLGETHQSKEPPAPWYTTWQPKRTDPPR